MKSKAEVGESLRELVLVLLGNETPNMKRDLANAVVFSLVDDLCDEPEGKSLLSSQDPTDDTKPSYWVWLDRRLDRPYLGPLSYERALPEDYLLPGIHQNPMRYAIGPGWRGRKVRITVTDVTNGKPQPKPAADMAQAWEEGWTARDNHGSGGTANNPYHVNFQGLKRPEPWPESWVEERKALFEENAQLRAELANERSITWKPVADLQADAEGHRQDRQDELKEELEALTKWLAWGAKFIGAEQAGAVSIKTKEIFGRVTEIAESCQARLVALKEDKDRNQQANWGWMEWARTIVFGIGFNSAQLLEATRQEVAALQQTARANELRANETKERCENLHTMLQAARAQCEVGRQYPLERHVEFVGARKWTAFEATIPNGLSIKAARKVVLNFPENYAGQKFRIEVARST